MHGAPSVTFPVGRSLFGGAVTAGGWLVALACVATWLAAGALGWRAGAGVVSLVIAGAWAAWDWRRTPVGRLAWDGAAWSFQRDGQGAESGALSAALDLQRVLLVRWQGPRRHWFWLERRSDPARWDALRRAVYSRPDDDAPSGAEPPPSTP